MICCICGKDILVNHGKPEWDGAYCEKCYEEVKNNSQAIIDSFKTNLVVGKLSTNPSHIIHIENCAHIYLTQKGIDLSFEIPKDTIERCQEIIINGHKFVREPD